MEIDFSVFDYNVVVPDPGLARYIDLSPIITPHSQGKHANRFMGKSKVNIIERLINNMMRGGPQRGGEYQGKKTKAEKVVFNALRIVAERTKDSPIQVLVNAISNAAPVEEVVRLVYAGISVPRAVDTSPQRRVDLAIRNIALAAINSTHKNRKPAEECLADEIILASRNDVNSKGVSRKEEMERIAKSAR
ncbi:MAG: 30S ribosomal protein S7 [Candidatus Thermoplasmatota archaeon]|nr:30S ribosomal protein S7 [Candidatus Thermoplasmatota archaeon]